jgi:hypothetical protein
VLPSTSQGTLLSLWPDHEEKMVHSTVAHVTWCSGCKVQLMGNTSYWSYLEHVKTSYRSSGREVTQLKITIFQEKQFNYYIFLIRVFKIEESETANTYVGKKGILHT